jgi:hypothetical protein
LKISRLTTLFKVWLENNSKRFKYKPIGISKDKYIFAGINPNISLKIINSLNMMIVNYHFEDEEDEYDHIEIGWIQTLAYEENKGFTDLGWVEPYNNRYYPSYEELVYENIFEMLLKFCDEKFIEDNYYCLIIENGFSMADICTNSKFEKFKENNLEEHVFKLDLFIRSDIETVPR